VVASDSVIAIACDALFVGDDPQSWAEATAAVLFAEPPAVRGQDAIHPDPNATFDALVANRERDWRRDIDNHLHSFTGTSIDATVNGLSSLFAENTGRISGDSLRDYLLRDRRIPPGLAWLTVVAFVRGWHGEAALNRSADVGPMRLNRHTVSSFSYRPEMIHAVTWLSVRQIRDWSSALPYVRVFLPHARDTGEDSGSAQDVQLMQALETVESRLSLAVHTLRSAVGQSIEKVNSFRSTERLIDVLKARTWQEFLASATVAFPDTKQFAEAVQQATRLRTLAEDILDVRTAHDYVSMADFGRADHALGSEAELLKVRLDINEVLEGHVPALSIIHDFQQWRRRYSSVYRTFHAEKRHSNQLLSREVRSADAKLDALRKLVALPVLEMTVPTDFEALWAELKKPNNALSNHRRFSLTRDTSLLH
jgi:hypothetical protein